MITREQAIEAFEAKEKHQTIKAAADSLNIHTDTLKRRISRYYADPEAIIYRNAKENRVPFEDVKLAWIKNKEVSMLWKGHTNVVSYEDMRDKIIEEMDKHSPVYTIPENKFKTEKNLLVIDAADIHFGKLSLREETGYEYNIKIASDRMDKAVDDILAKGSLFNPEKIVFVIGNDVIHIDKPGRTTTNGTPQDTDGQWWQMFLAAKLSYIKSIEKMALYAPVHVVFCPSNHDYMSGWMLADTISSWFRNHPNVTFGDNNRSISIAHRKYVVYGQNLIGFTHGDGAKHKDLKELMQYEAKQAWSRSKYAYFYIHHFHHKDKQHNGKLMEKDYIGLTVLSPSVSQKPEMDIYIETVRSPSPADRWHSTNGYVNRCAIEAFVHHHEDGQVGRLTHYF